MQFAIECTIVVRRSSTSSCSTAPFSSSTHVPISQLSSDMVLAQLMEERGGWTLLAEYEDARHISAMTPLISHIGATVCTQKPYVATSPARDLLPTIEALS